MKKECVMNYIPLNIKTHYEILSSLIKIEDLVYMLKKNNVSSLGITDSNMFGSLEFINLCKRIILNLLLEFHF